MVIVVETANLNPKQDARCYGLWVLRLRVLKSYTRERMNESIDGVLLGHLFIKYLKYKYIVDRERAVGVVPPRSPCSLPHKARLQ